ncbi:MAG: BON domain-containing protein [Gammaproteobacteria bacterium]|nr:BON domain-containing protein [Gammaproteobacteria bacterium]NNC96652.1 BON domain-containing protein [Gammaproteobacteria bacterium]NNM14292.1 BON domain-containing protein [Gammaproteobacteria bacterium]
MNFKYLLLLTIPMLLSACVVVIGDDDGELSYGHEQDIYSSHHDNESETHLSNYALPERVQNKFSDDAVLFDRNISVTAKNGIVYLHGEVFSQSDLDRAVTLALEEEDVVAVSSRLILTIAK